jgi:hypothetical protein
MLTINRVEVTDPGGNVRRLSPLPQEQVEGVGLASLPALLNGGGTPLYYRLTDGVIELFPASTTAITDGLAVYFERDSVQFVSTDTTRSPGFASPFHYLAPVLASMKWYKAKQPKSATLAELKEDWAKGEDDLRQYYAQRWRDYRPRLNTPQQDWR